MSIFYQSLTHCPQLEQFSLQPSTVLHHRHLLQTNLLQQSPTEVNPSTHYSIYHFLNNHDKISSTCLVMPLHRTILICNNHLEEPICIHLVKILVGKPCALSQTLQM